MNRIRLISVLLLFQLSLSAQENDTIPLPDSLMTELAISNTNEDSINIYINISDYYRGISSEKRLGFAIKADSISKTNNKRLQSKINLTLAKGYFNFSEFDKTRKYLHIANNLLLNDTSLEGKKLFLEIFELYGFSYFIEENYEKAIGYYFNAEKIITEIKDTTRFAADIYSLLALLYTNLKIEDKAIKPYQKALHLYTKLQDTVQISDIYNGLGVIYSNQKKYKQAIKFYKEYLRYSKLKKNEVSTALALNNIGFEFSLIGKYDSAEVYLKKSIKISKNIEDTLYLANTYHSLGAMYSKAGDLENAVAYLLKAKEQSWDGDFELECHVEIDLANILNKKGEFNKALKKLNRVEEITTKNNLKYAYVKLLKIYVDIYSKKGDYKKAIEYQKIISEKESKLHNETIDRDLANLGIRYTIQQLETKIQQLEKITKIQDEDVTKELQFNLYLVAFSLIMLILAALFIFMRRINKKYRKVLRKKNEQLEKNKESLETMNNELIEINASKDRFFNLIAFNLKKPFVTLLDYSERIITDYDKLSKKEIVKYNELINFTALDLFELLENLLYWSRFEIGTLELNLKKYKLNEFIDDNLSWFRNKVNIKGIFLNTNFSEEIFVKFDKNLMSLVMRNLISNALDKTNVNGIIKITTIKYGNTIEVSVEDNGSDSKKKPIKDIFSIRHIGDSPTKGLGLIVSNKIVEMHTSKLTILNKEKIGTRLSFKLNLN